MDYRTIRHLDGIASPLIPPCAIGPRLSVDDVPLADLYSIIGATLNLEPLGFCEESVGRWTRGVQSHLSHVLYVNPVADAAYELTWGVDLPGFPRTDRHTPDLFEGVCDYVLTSRHELDRVRVYHISAHHGCASTVHDVKRVWRLLRPIVFAWWEGATTLDAVADRAHRQSRRNRLGPAHNPDPAAVERYIYEHASK